MVNESVSDTTIRARRDEWIASGEPWGPYFLGWAQQHGLNSARELVRDLDERFERLACNRGPYFFVELEETSEKEELTAIETGRIQAAPPNAS